MTDSRASRGGPQRIPRPPGTRTGPKPSWADLSDDARRAACDIDHIRSVLAAGPKPRQSPVEPLQRRASAVLAPMYVDDDGTTRVVMTRRAGHLRSHAGEVSFPGGGQEADDVTLWDTATRESQEEIGLDPDSVERIGELHHLSTVTSRSFIVPFVGVLPGRPTLTPNQNEVDTILEVAIEELLLPEVYRQERWGVPPMLDRPIHFFELVGDTVWGATASMLVDLLDRITAR